MVHLTTVHEPFDPRIFYKQVGSLRDAGFDSHLMAPYDRDEQKEGIALHAIRSAQSRLERLLLQLQTFRKARKLEADVYQIHDPELIPLGYLLKKVTGAKIVYDMHENYRSKGPLLGWGLRMIERWCFQWVDHVLLAEESYQSIVSGRGVDHTCILNYFVPIGTDSTPERRSSSSSTPRRLIYTGTISDERGLDTMLDLAFEVRRRDRTERLEIVGRCWRPVQRKRAEERLRGE